MDLRTKSNYLEFNSDALKKKKKCAAFIAPMHGKVKQINK